MKCAIVIGHTENKKGAYSSYFKKCEWDFWNDVASYLTNIDIITHNKDISGYVTRQKDTARRMASAQYDMSMEVHFNSLDEIADGCETLYYNGNIIMRKAALLFNEIVCQQTGIRNRGVKELSNIHDRGYGFVRHQKSHALLLEPFFGHNAADCKLIESASNMACMLEEFVSSEVLNDLIDFGY